MLAINEITRENFQINFNLMDILEDSVFYPASGIDAKDIECLSKHYCSFIHVDYSTPKEVVESGMRHHFEGVGYDLIGLMDVNKEALAPYGFRPLNLALNEHEIERLKNDFIHERFYCRNFSPFALWAVYELRPSKTDENQRKSKRFSLLHIGGEACDTFEAIYFANKINPSAIAIINPGEGYGDNWTIFTDPKFRLYQSLELNNIRNDAKMPDTLLSHLPFGDMEDCFWPDYQFKKRCDNGWLSLYARK